MSWRPSGAHPPHILDDGVAQAEASDHLDAMEIQTDGDGGSEPEGRTGLIAASRAAGIRRLAGIMPAYYLSQTRVIDDLPRSNEDEHGVFDQTYSGDRGLRVHRRQLHSPRAGNRPADLDHQPRRADLRRQPRQPGGPRGHPRYRFVHGDIADRAQVSKLVAGGEFDAIVNFAAESHVDRSISDATPFLRTNVLGTQCLLDAAREAKVPRYVQVSTDEVYGTLKPDDPRSPRRRRWPPTALMPPARRGPISWSVRPTTRTGWIRSSPAARTTTVRTSSPRS